MKTRERVRAYFEENPGATYRQAKAALGLRSLSQVHSAIHGKSRHELMAEHAQLRRALELVDRYLCGQPVSRQVVVTSVTAALRATEPTRTKRTKN